MSEKMHRNEKKKEWIVSKDEVGRAVLRWNLDAKATTTPAQDDDPLAKTYNFLRRLEVASLSLEGEFGEEECNPYNSGVYSAGPFRDKR